MTKPRSPSFLLLAALALVPTMAAAAEPPASSRPHEIWVDPAMTSFTAWLSYRGEKAPEMELVDPDGRTIDRQAAERDPAFTHTFGTDQYDADLEPLPYQTFRATDPIPGRWLVRIDGRTESPAVSGFTLHSFSEVENDAVLEHALRVRGDAVSWVFELRMEDPDDTEISEAAGVFFPEDQTPGRVEADRLAFADDGHGFDHAPGDGVWTSAAWRPAVEGEHTVVVDLRGRMGEHVFTRRATIQMPYVDLSNRLVPRAGERIEISTHALPRVFEVTNLSEDGTLELRAEPGGETSSHSLLELYLEEGVTIRRSPPG